MLKYLFAIALLTTTTNSWANNPIADGVYNCHIFKITIRGNNFDVYHTEKMSDIMLLSSTTYGTWDQGTTKTKKSWKKLMAWTGAPRFIQSTYTQWYNSQFNETAHASETGIFYSMFLLPSGAPGLLQQRFYRDPDTQSLQPEGTSPSYPCTEQPPLELQ